MLDVDKEVVAGAFNLWMDEYTDHPERFQRDWEMVHGYLTEKSAGKVPSYGEAAAESLHRYLRKFNKVQEKSDGT